MTGLKIDVIQGLPTSRDKEGWPKAVKAISDDKMIGESFRPSSAKLDRLTAGTCLL